MSAAQSTHYKHLRSQINKLKILLPKKDLYGSYTELQKYRMISYRVLCHAALESYFESVSRDLLEKCHHAWLSHNVMGKYFISLCFRFSRSTEMKDSAFFNKQKGDSSLLVKDAFEWHSETIKNNHGIKEHNLESLFRPYGNGVIDKFSVLFADLDSYAAVRGQYAHTTPSSIQQVPDPDDEKKIASELTTAIAPVDQDLRSCLSSI